MTGRAARGSTAVTGPGARKAFYQRRESRRYAWQLVYEGAFRAE